MKFLYIKFLFCLYQSRSYLFANVCSCSYRIWSFLLQHWLQNSVHRTRTEGCSGIPQDFWPHVNINTVCKTGRLGANNRCS